MSVQAPTLLDKVVQLFALEPGRHDEAHIEEHAHLLLHGNAPDLLKTIPAHMAWCLRNPESTSLVIDYTIDALANTGRAKSPVPSWLDFKHRCSTEQRRVVADFLHWCLDTDRLVDRQQTERALKHWAP
ncbi:hypothetical protein [Roseateles sp. BYS96W]|uniref:Uncharacterized protein n=1 Tax=Pelomonas nitida TaxID=3299027 RepID=A0ABW7G8B0_9BURK